MAVSFPMSWILIYEQPQSLTGRQQHELFCYGLTGHDVRESSQWHFEYVHSVSPSVPLPGQPVSLIMRNISIMLCRHMNLDKEWLHCFDNCSRVSPFG